MILVSEIYGPVIQGEGMVAGRPTIFVRTAGCDFKCGQDEEGHFTRPFVCDSLYAVLSKYHSEWKRMTDREVLDAIQVLADPPILVTLSGGNPALQDFGVLIDAGHALGYRFAIETQGTKLPYWTSKLDSVTVSPKPPSSGMTTDWGKLTGWLTVPDIDEKCLKVVVFDNSDFEYAREVRALAREFDVPMYLQAGTSNPYGETDTFEGLSIFRESILQRTAWLGQKVIDAQWYDVRVLPQIHALINGAKRGV